MTFRERIVWSRNLEATQAKYCEKHSGWVISDIMVYSGASIFTDQEIKISLVPSHGGKSQPPSSRRVDNILLCPPYVAFEENIDGTTEHVVSRSFQIEDLRGGHEEGSGVKGTRLTF
ncbi:hypothetical protein QCA50_008132 [Cerrena zonata]|uniref:Uncharacterized protein n=1 Tax=Cerrena zonata TaxID=2478898 RepID=A0AAW0GBA4_9APHY